MNPEEGAPSAKRRRMSEAGLPEDPSSSVKKPRVDESSSSSSGTGTSLETLLDLSDVENQDQLQERFDTIANALLCDYHLVVTRPGVQVKLEVMELEFYLQKEGFHEDPFTHGSEEQRVAGRWYFHRAPKRSEDSNRSLTSTTSWRGGSRKGLDVTIGRLPVSTSSTNPGPHSLLRGGILLRSIRVLGPKPKVVSGPSLLVDEVLLLSGASDIGDLVNGKWEGNTSAFASKDPDSPLPSHTLHIEPRETKTTTTVIYNSPRIGLDLSHPGTTGSKVRPYHSRIRFLPRMYRYFREPHLLVANGRCQTFVGVLHHCAKGIAKPKKPQPALEQETTVQTAAEQFTSALKDLRLLGNICRTMGLKEVTAKKYLDDFRHGRKGGGDVLDQFVGSKGKGASSSPQKYLVMMGALSALQMEGES